VATCVNIREIARHRSFHATRNTLARACSFKGAPIRYRQHDLTTQTLLEALSYSAQYLDNHNYHAVIITVGGAVNTLLLNSRATTHDVDFFGGHLSPEELDLVRRAGQYAVDRSSAPLSDDWLNNATERIPGVMENVSRLFRAAEEQDKVVFDAPGLTALAAPWNYAFVKKVNRIAEGKGRPYDMHDALSYLHEYICCHRGHPVHVMQIRRWGIVYLADVPDDVLEEVDQKHVEAYRRHGIVLTTRGGNQEGLSHRKCALGHGPIEDITCIAYSSRVVTEEVSWEIF
jgi:hypothetical protein